MSISFSGLASGLDTTSWVESLVSLKQEKIDTLEEEKDVVAQMQETLAGIKTFFNSFRSVIEKVTDAKFGIASMDIFAQNLATSSNLEVLTASVTSEAEEATYDLEVDQLATATEALSNYTYTTTIIQTSVATLDSKLVNLGVKINTGGSQIGVKVNGVEHGLTLSENETIGSFIDKLKGIGIEASYNTDTGIFSMNINAGDINDIDKTGIVDALHLEGVNEGYVSNNLEITHTDTVYSAATESTLLSDLGVKAGMVTIRANDQNYTVTVKSDTTLGSFIQDLNNKNIDASLVDGTFTLSDAEITNEGTTDILDALGFETDIFSQTQTSGDLNYTTVVTEITTATDSTLIKDLGEGVTFNNNSTVIVKNSNNQTSTVTLTQTSTLGDLLEGLNNAGLSASINENGEISITGGVITGGTFDIDGVLGLTSEPYSAMVSGNALTETVEEEVIADTSTRLVEDLGVKAGYVKVEDANGVEHYTKISSGLTLGSFVNTLNSYGLSASLDSSGVLSVTGGTITTLTDSEVSSLVTSGKISESNASLRVGSDVLDKLFGTGEIVYGSSVSKSGAMTYSVTNTLNATNTTTLGQLGLTKNGNISVGGQTVAVTTGMTIDGLISAIEAKGIDAAWDSGLSKITIDAKVTDTGSTGIITALGLEETVTSKYASSNALYSKETVVADATTATKLSEFGITDSMSAADRTVKIYNADGDLRKTITVTSNSTLGNLVDAINQTGDVQAKVKDGRLLIEDGYIDNSALEIAMGLEYTSGSSFVLGSVMTTTSNTAATGDSTLGEIISALGTSSSVSGGYNLSFNGKSIAVNSNTTLNDIISSIYLNGGSASLDSSGRLNITGGTVSGSVATALGIKTTIITTGVSTTGKTLYTETEEFADRNTTLGDLGISNSSYVINNSNGTAIKTINVSSTSTLGSIMDTLASNGIDATIASGVITMNSINGNYITGSLANSLGISHGTRTEVINTTSGGTLTVNYTGTVTASTSSTLGEVGAIKNSSDNILIYDSDNKCIATISTLTI